MTSHFFMAAHVASTRPRHELGKVAFSSMFLKRKKSLRFGAVSYSEQKNHFAIGHNSEHCSYHTDLSRFVLPISDPSALNFSQFVGFQNSPNLSKIEQVAETCEFDGKEPLFVERTIAISIRVFGRNWYKQFFFNLGVFINFQFSARGAIFFDKYERHPDHSTYRQKSNQTK